MIDVERLLPLAELQGQMDKFVASAEAAQPFPGEPAAYLPGKLATIVRSMHRMVDAFPMPDRTLATMLSDARSRLLLTSTC